MTALLHTPVPLDDIVITDELARRPVRTADQPGESQALVALMRRLNDPDAADGILQSVAEAALSLCHAGSSGISILEQGEAGEYFRWHGAAGLWHPYAHEVVPRLNSPCGLALDRGTPLLMRHPERHFPFDASALPPLEEVLLLPFSVAGRQVGTIWVIAHETGRHFDAEDLRLLTDLGEVACVAHQLTEQRRELRAALERERAGTRLLQSISGGMVVEDDASALYEQILDAALALMNAPCASLQSLEDDGRLRLLAWRGLHPESARRWAVVDDAAASVCAQARNVGGRLVVADVEASEALAGTDDLLELRRCGIRAVQSTPLLSRDGRCIGVMSTHWHEPHTPSADGLRLFDVLARETADLMERAHAAAALREAVQRKDEFLAVLGHELRNPLAPLATGIELLRRGGQTTDFVERIHAMMGRQLDHLTRLVDDLLDLSRITRGELDLQLARIDLRTVVDTAVELARPAIDRGRHELSVEVANGPVLVHGDLERLTQIVANLLTNAARYAEPGGHIRLTARCEGQAAVLRVADRGFGIPARSLERIFDMFAQVPEHRERRDSGGLGIGLALSRRLAELHRGTLTAHSLGLGHGSEFSLRLPATVADAGPDVQAAAPSPAGPQPCRVLIVDDNIDAATSLCMALRLDRHEVEVAYDGPQALALAERFVPQAMLIDIGLPGMDGYELARRIRQRDPGRRILLAAVTGWGQGSDREQAFEAGFDLHLTKPVRMDDVQAALAQASGR